MFLFVNRTIWCLATFTWNLTYFLNIISSRFVFRKFCSFITCLTCLKNFSKFISVWFFCNVIYNFVCCVFLWITVLTCFLFCYIYLIFFVFLQRIVFLLIFYLFRKFPWYLSQIVLALYHFYWYLYVSYIFNNRFVNFFLSFFLSYFYI